MLKSSSFHFIPVQEAVSLLEKVIERETYMMKETQKWKDIQFPN
ncbi:hypothetical protein [Bacillus cereus group sp. N21]